MGMSASQARLLSITARLSNNEHAAQTLSYDKQRLADQTQQITNEYNEALKATKLTVLTGFDGAQANYEDISYSLMVGMQMAESTRQYVVTDTKGRILVSEEVADAYIASRGNFNTFLAQLNYDSANLGKTGPYSQSDITVQFNDADGDAVTRTKQLVHEAWDKYFESVGINFGDNEHDGGYGWVCTVKDGKEEGLGFGFTSYNGDLPINYEGSTAESRDLYDYAMSITEAFYRVAGEQDASGKTIETGYVMDDIKSANDMDNTSSIKYYKNIFNRIQQNGFITYTDTAAKAHNDDSYIYSNTTVGTGKVAKNPLKDNSTFESALRNGTLRLEFYSTTQRSFQSITVSEDNCIQEVADERKIAQAESKYTQDMADLESKDKKFDLNLKRLDTEHNALQTEYESMKTIIDKNIENSFKTFS